MASSSPFSNVLNAAVGTGSSDQIDNVVTSLIDNLRIHSTGEATGNRSRPPIARPAMASGYMRSNAEATGNRSRPPIARPAMASGYMRSNAEATGNRSRPPIARPAMASSVNVKKVQRQKIDYYCSFGGFGKGLYKLFQPIGLAVNAKNDVFVADGYFTKVFGADGTFKFEFDCTSYLDGQPCRPSRLVINKISGDIIVLMRNATSELHVYSQIGTYKGILRAGFSSRPCSITIDSWERIIVVESNKVRVTILNINGSLLQQFTTKELVYPSSVAANNLQEIFISDQKLHLVKVFGYNGTYLRQIADSSFTIFPIRVGISSAGHVVIVDNYLFLNITIFSRDGQLLYALESKTSHYRCRGVAFLDNDTIVMLAKNNRIYSYSYRCDLLPSIGQ